MATFQQRIEDYTGPVSDASALNGWLTSAARLHTRLIPRSELMQYASVQSVLSEGLPLSDTIVLSVDKAGNPSTLYPSNMRGRLNDIHSMHRATEFTPAHVVFNGRLFVYPNGGNAQTVTLPRVAYGDSSISVLPADLEDATVVFAALQQVISTLSKGGGGTGGASGLKGIDLADEFDKVDVRLEDDDIELARGRIDKINAMISEFSSELNSSTAAIQSIQGQYNTLIAPYMQGE